jgi:hypothetical protein
MEDSGSGDSAIKDGGFGIGGIQGLRMEDSGSGDSGIKDGGFGIGGFRD